MQSGTFCLSACTIVQRRGQPLIGTYSIGILTKAPTPEGLRSEELVADGYSRQPVHFEPPAEYAEVVRSGNRVSFGELGMGSGGLKQGAVYDQEGNLVAYGLFSVAPHQIASSEIAFEPGAIQVRY